MRTAQLFSLVAAVTLLIASSASAANIAWNAPVAVTTNGSASDVVSLGKTVEAQYASSNGLGPQTVHGITFQENFSSYTAGGPTVQALQGFTTGNAAYDTILNGFYYDGPNPNTLTLTGLTIGKTYEVQLWGLDNRGCCGTRQESFTGGANTSNTISLNTDVSVTGKFVADATSQIVLVTGALSETQQGQTNLNAFSVTTAPEPSSFVLCGLGAAGLIVAIRRRRRA